MIYYFIYETTNLINGKKYRGMHQTSNLEDGYLGSGLYFVNAVKKYGSENFIRKIIEFCGSYDELIEKEKIYVNDDWVRNENTYNLKTGGQSTGILSEESKKKISETLKEGYKSGRILKLMGVKYITTEEINLKISNTLKERYKNQPHHQLGREPWNKNTKGLQMAWNKGLKLGPQSEESKRKKSEILKERYKNQPHHSLGVEPWNKGKKGSQIAWNKGKEMPKLECPHCGKFADIANAKRWHFDNCKFKNNVSN